MLTRRTLLAGLALTPLAWFCKPETVAIPERITLNSRNYRTDGFLDVLGDFMDRGWRYSSITAYPEGECEVEMIRNQPLPLTRRARLRQI